MGPSLPRYVTRKSDSVMAPTGYSHEGFIRAPKGTFKTLPTRTEVGTPSSAQSAVESLRVRPQEEHRFLENSAENPRPRLRDTHSVPAPSQQVLPGRPWDLGQGGRALLAWKPTPPLPRGGLLLPAVLGRTAPLGAQPPGPECPGPACGYVSSPGKLANSH